jgi:hypothetical protein
MKDMLENLSVALGYKGEITEAVQLAAENMLASGMNYIEINAYALLYINLPGKQYVRKTSGITKDLA